MSKLHLTQGAAETTASMQDCSLLSAPDHEDHPGLVLLYAPDYEKIPPAYVLRDEAIVIGREPGATVHIPQAAISRKHARIEQRGEAWVIVDLGGRNGTLVNGQFVRETPLHHLDLIRVGDALFKFVAEDAAGYAHYRIDGAYLADPGSGEVSGHSLMGRLVGGYRIQRLAAETRPIARSDLSVLILGESGTGKEVFARQVHDWSGRRGAFQAINCAAIPLSLIEGELFGHRRGAFSGADRDRPGLIRAAHGGTLFLDEIGDMPLEAQAKLLRVIQSREVTPLGATQPEPVDVRFVCATHRDLDLLQQREAFRHDLYARLNEHSVTLPPLRERKEDLFVLCQALAARHGRPEPRVTFAFMMALVHYDFPFNVRELEAIIKRWTAVARDDVLDLLDLPDEIKAQVKDLAQGRRPRVTRSSEPILNSPPAAPALSDTIDKTAPATPRPRRGAAPGEHDLRALLDEHRGNVAAIGRLFGKDRVQVHRWMKRYGIKVDDYR